jgi:ABC-2 type transport system ATP-binding protein
MAAQNSNTVVRAVGLSKEFRDFWNRPKAKAVNDIDFEIKEGEVVGLLGPNGSGKSTTVKMLLGLLYPTAGSLSVFGNSPRDVATKKQIGYLPEESYLYKYLTALETLDFFGSLFNLSKAERRKRSEQLLDMVGLSHAKRRRVGEFSKGMQRRIGLAQSMINDPSLLILDEPTSGLDPIGCREVKDLITTLKKRGKTVLITSHLLSDVEDICDRVIILYGGKVRATGTLNELLTINQESRITTPLMDPKVTEKALEILRKELKGETFEIDHPRMSLENFFLDVVNSARAEIDTAGVTSDGKIANYLSEEDIKTNAVLEDLTKDIEKPKIAPEVVEEKIAPKLEDKNITLQNLTEEVASVAPVVEDTDKTVADTASENLTEADNKLKDLLGGK